ncbi:MAG: PAS domain-containing protein [Deltaproteobacteria bacterium]|nr:PAS domain-containing protein [Deltaproteobacteria bacterium]
MGTSHNARTPGSESKLGIAVIGGGRRCRSLLEVLETADPKTGFKAEIVGVADIDPAAEGYRYARAAGVFTTQDYNDLFDLHGVDLVINLTGNKDLCPAIARSAPAHIPVLPYPAAVLFQEIVHEVLTASRRVAEQADEIHRTKSFVRAVAQATIVGAMVLDTDYRIQWINKAGAGMAGIDEKEALGKYCFQVSHHRVGPCTFADVACPMQETLKTGLTAHAIHEHMLGDGSKVFCDVTTFPLFNKAREVVEVVEFIRDITSDINHEVERRTTALKKDLAKLVQEDKLIALGKMVASVAHEINNPIGSIINFTKLVRNALREGDLDEAGIARYERYLDLSLREAERCGRIVTNLLSFSRQQAVDPKTIDLGAMLDDIAALTRHKLELADIEFRKRIYDEPLCVWGDYTQIQQCFVNLIFNAIEAMPEGGRLTIRGGRDEDRNEAWLDVSDTGTGIAEEHLSSIFEPFFTTKTDGYGVGLGLSMVYGIIREHRGRITVKSEAGKGATFRVTLPVAPEEGGMP